MYTEEFVVEGWEGKAKGMLQILWERGFIDSNKLDQYTVDGRKDDYGNLIPETSLKHLMEQLPDFQDEPTLLQFHGEKLGVKVDRTPKCHPEVAGEGVEYDWGCAKGYYRRLPLKMKKGKDNFRESVKKSLDTQIVLTIARQRKFSRRAREYMLAYHTLDNTEEVDENDLDDAEAKEKKPLMSAYLIEKIIKQYKCHRSAADFNTGFIARMVVEMKGGAMRSKLVTTL